MFSEWKIFLLLKVDSPGVVGGEDEVISIVGGKVTRPLREEMGDPLDLRNAGEMAQISIVPLIRVKGSIYKGGNVSWLRGRSSVITFLLSFIFMELHSP